MIDPRLHQTIQQILGSVPFLKNPYFLALEEGRFAREDFLETQIQFYSAVRFFNRPMAILAAKIPDALLRSPIIQNVWEEHGEGDLAKGHGATFLLFLERLGRLSPASIESRKSWPEVKIFNTSLMGACLLDDYRIGASALGMVERMFLEISSKIGRLVLERGWLSRAELVHYDLHETLDVRHSEDFFKIIEADWQAGGPLRDQVEEGLWMGAVLFDSLYSGLYEHRARRWLNPDPL